MANQGNGVAGAHDADDGGIQPDLPPGGGGGATGDDGGIVDLSGIGSGSE